MFVSTRRPMIIPQAEHARLAAQLAARWGNEHFLLPPLPPTSLVKGIALHDRGYGHFDNYPLSQISDEVWLRITQTGFFMPEADLVADTVTKLHLKRLMSHSADEHQQALTREWEGMIADQIKQTGIHHTVFAWGDHITEISDKISYSFCFEAPMSDQVEEITTGVDGMRELVTFSIADDGEIQVSPWPFAQSALSGFIFGYASEEYPHQLTPILVPYRCVPSNERNEELATG